MPEKPKNQPQAFAKIGFPVSVEKSGSSAHRNDIGLRIEPDRELGKAGLELNIRFDVIGSGSRFEVAHRLGDIRDRLAGAAFKSGRGSADTQPDFGSVRLPAYTERSLGMACRERGNGFSRYTPVARERNPTVPLRSATTWEFLKAAAQSVQDTGWKPMLHCCLA